MHPDRLWYVAYGSNLSLERFRCYLVGGRPAGAARTYPGCRDHRPPADIHSLMIPGGLYFAGRSAVWGGGMAFLDPDASTHPSGVAARAYLLARMQFLDVLTQEMHRMPGVGQDSSKDPILMLTDGAQHALGPGRYETVVRVGTLDSLPLLTFTAPTSACADLQPPSRPYLATLAAGLREAHGWSASEVAVYLLERPGLHPHWSHTALLQL